MFTVNLNAKISCNSRYEPFSVPTHSLIFQINCKQSHIRFVICVDVRPVAEGTAIARNKRPTQLLTKEPFVAFIFFALTGMSFVEIIAYVSSVIFS